LTKKSILKKLSTAKSNTQQTQAKNIKKLDSDLNTLIDQNNKFSSGKQFIKNSKKGIKL
jgi:hypothetical protein